MSWRGEAGQRILKQERVIDVSQKEKPNIEVVFCFDQTNILPFIISNGK